jgi:FAD:protein FMN transferase
MPTERRGAFHVEHVMGMPVGIDIRDDIEVQDADAAIADVVDWLHLVDETWSTWKDDSLITRFARGDVTPDELPTFMHRILDRCELLSAETGGAFDIHVPAPNGTRLEPSGFIKGWAVEQAAAFLTMHGITNAAINAGGDIAVRGAADPVAATGWTVGVRHPQQADALAASLRLHGQWAVATSGAYERGAHIIDPRTGQPAASGLQSVTVIGADLALVDVAATAIFVMGLDGLDWLLDRPRTEALDAFVITDDNRCVSTPGFDAHRVS